MSEKILGVDIGNVIINHRGQQDMSIDRKEYSLIPAESGVFEALNYLKRTTFPTIYLVSRCSSWAEESILEWLRANDFYTKTGIMRNQVYFCRERHQKAEVCLKLGITHFIDDRMEILSYLNGKVRNLYLFKPDLHEFDLFKNGSNKVDMIDGWDSFLKKVA
jgi:hypothetical protein